MGYTEEKGNSIALINFKAEHDHIVADHMQNNPQMQDTHVLISDHTKQSYWY
jgi:hypothetical protein